MRNLGGFYSKLDSELTIVIPVRSGSSPNITLKSLAKQTYRDFKVFVVYDSNNLGACWARNRGFESVTSPFVLFSDDDIEWDRTALESMVNCLKSSNAGYSYGWWEMNSQVYSKENFSSYKLITGPYISTMSVFRSEIFPKFDENLPRLHDWDVYLVLLKRGIKGVFCGSKIFSTAIRDGITFGSKVTFDDAKKIVVNKHNLDLYVV